MEEIVKNAGKTHLKPYQFKPGNPGGPGRPKGKTIKERVREYLEKHPDDMESFIKHFVKENRDLAWRMLEGNPRQGITGEDENGNPEPLLGKLSNGNHNNSNPKITETEEEN